MSIVQTRYGPADHERPLALDEFDSAEIIDGRLCVSPLPNPAENILETWLYQELLWYQKTHSETIGFVTNKARVFVKSGRKATIPEPDIAGYAGLDLSGSLHDLSWRDLHPILLVEVLVEGDPSKDLVRNPELYLAVPSIKEYWVLDGRDDAERPTLIQHRRHGKRWIIRKYPFGSTFATKMLPGFSLIINPSK
jgi:Uma2 family endonuclease